MPSAQKKKTMTSMSTSSLYPFPPSSIAHNSAAIVDECEVAEMTAANTDPSVPIVEIAALLYMGEYIHARHLWRRHRDVVPASTRAALQEWWNLGRSMMEWDFPQVWARLAGLKQHPAPFFNYAQEVGDSFRRRTIPKLATVWDTPQDSLLGLPRQDWVVFLEHYRKEAAEKARKHTDGVAFTDIISFLESPSVSV